MKKTVKRTKHELYEESVQNPDFEVELMRRVYRRHRKKQPRTLREDFCGTAVVCREWVRQIPDGEAIGIDLHEPTLRWGEKHNLNRLGDERSRVKLVRGDVMEAGQFKTDIVAALNFSYFIFKERAKLLQYFTNVHKSLNQDGIFVIDLYGGPEAQVEQEESTEQDSGFDYVWDQAYFNPVTGETKCYIHFDFPDGSRMKRAFSYDWRLWSVPELKDVLADAGFKESVVYWEGTDEDDGGGNGEFEISNRGDDAQSWVAYIIALK